MVEVLSYGSHELQKIRLFQASKSKDAILFIHGGGWRDPLNTFDDFQPLMKHFSSRDINVLSANYRLSPKISSEEMKTVPPFHHPLHFFDILKAISFLQKQDYNIILIIGHSVGASFGLQLLNFDEVIQFGMKHISQPNISSELNEIKQQLLSVKLRSLFLVDGIFNVESLLQEYGDDYRSFVSSAFKSDEHFKDAFQLSNPDYSVPHQMIDKHTKIYIVHSTDDELLSTKQSMELKEYFSKCSINCELILEPWGKHEEVYTRKELAVFIDSSF